MPVRATLADDGGFVVTELLVACVMAVVALGLTTGMAFRAFADTNTAIGRSQSAAAAQAGLERLALDLRHATGATITATSAQLDVPVRGATLSGTPASQRVVWTCTVGGSCTRQAGAGPAVPVVKGVASASFAPVAADGSTTLPAVDPVSVTVTLATTALREDGKGAVLGDERPLVVREAGALRNFSG